MREIKFRAWDTENRRMLIQDTDFGYISTRGVDLLTTNAVSKGLRHNTNVILLQFTGLTDKNGKEIYEGDIIKSKHYLPDENGRYSFPSNENNSEIRLSIVTWNENAARFDNTLGEVIGNIYENPELLKEQP